MFSPPGIAMGMGFSRSDHHAVSIHTVNVDSREVAIDSIGDDFFQEQMVILVVRILLQVARDADLVFTGYLWLVI